MYKRAFYPLVVILTFIFSALALSIGQFSALIIGAGLVIVLITYESWLIEMGIFSPTISRQNVNLQDALKDNIMKHGKLKNTILIFQGELSPLYFENNETLNIIANASMRGVEINVVFGPGIFRVMNFLKLAKEGRINLYQRSEPDDMDVNWEKYKKEGKFNHFVYVDGKWVWLERPHPPGECDNQGVVVCDKPLIAKACYDRFYEVSQTSKKINAEKLVESIGVKNFKEIDKNTKQVRPCNKMEMQELREYIGD
jgi:hypothetical protein